MIYSSYNQSITKHISLFYCKTFIAEFVILKTKQHNIRLVDLNTMKTTKMKYKYRTHT